MKIGSIVAVAFGLCLIARGPLLADGGGGGNAPAAAAPRHAGADRTRRPANEARHGTAGAKSV